MGNWVLCHVLLNKRSRKSFEDDTGKRLGSHEQMRPNFTRDDDDDDDDAISINCEEATSSSSSCGSSVVTQEESSSKSY